MALPKGQLLSNWGERQLNKIMAKVNIYTISPYEKCYEAKRISWEI